ncbi:MAG: hypothetical protein MRY83_23420, partial [Flavobacteriales bacterium]|nr:hypothetical protein [Flavobacteriales bacterium]
MEYKISIPNPSSNFIEIEFSVNQLKGDFLEVILPNWRPGRYELGNFAKNIQKWEIRNGDDVVLQYDKLTINKWRIHLNGSKAIKISYNYYAKELNAGSTFLSEDQLYVNPVNCLLYCKERIMEPCRLKLDIPKHYEVATNLDYSRGGYEAPDFHFLVDSP